MMRVIKEFFKPSLKCRRVGHEIVLSTKRIRRKSNRWHEVVADFDASFTFCKRCGHETKLLKEEKVDSFASCSMPDYMWKAMEKDGFLEIK